MKTRIEFKAIKGSPFFEGVTDRAAAVAYSYVNEDRLKYYTTSSELPDTDDEEAQQPTTLSMGCNFKVDGAMLDLIDQSKIVYVIGCKYDAEEGQSNIVFYPRSGFQYEKLQDVIVDLCEKFNL